MRFDSRHLLLVAAALPLMFGACSSEECEGNRNTLPYAGFYSSSISPQSIILDSISVWGLNAPGDSLLLDSASGISSVYLPFNPDAEETTYYIEYLQENLRGVTDRITFRYEAQPYFVSAACGVSYRFLINGIDNTHFVIDSVTVPGMVIDNTNTQNIRIYFRVNSDA